MKIITTVRYNGEWFEKKPDFATIEISTESAQMILGWMNEAERLRTNGMESLNRIEVFDYRVTYWEDHLGFSGVMLEEGKTLEEAIEENEILVLHESMEYFEPPEEAHVRVDVPTICVDNHNVYWTACIKHTNVEICTQTIEKETLEKIAKGERP
jgi:hypothetical protein